MKFPKFFKHARKMFKTRQYQFSWINNRLRNLRYPLYYYILLVNGGVYISWHSYIISKGFLSRNFMLSKENMGNGRLHTLLTHSITHLSFFHLLTNGIGIYFIGRHIEMIFGPRILLNCYLAGAITGGLF